MTPPPVPQARPSRALACPAAASAGRRPPTRSALLARLTPLLPLVTPLLALHLQGCSLAAQGGAASQPGVAGAQVGSAAPVALSADTACPAGALPRIYVPPTFQRALATGTRDSSGAPGPQYWQQRTDYALEAELDPATRLLQGRGTIRYLNASPDTLEVLVFRLYQNLFREDAKRLERVPTTGGVTLDSLVIGGTPLEVADEDSSQTILQGTLLAARLDRPILPGETREVRVVWRFTIPPEAAMRMGTVDSTSFFLAQWYPQLAVYDDLEGWALGEYLGPGEFYNEYGDFDVSVTVPAGFGVWATGTLQNPAETWSEPVRRRAEQAASSREVVHVLTPDDLGAGRATLGRAGDRLTWRFRAEGVRDFAFATGDHYLWDATSATLDAGAAGETEGRGAEAAGAAGARSATASAVYRPGAVGFEDVAELARVSLETFSLDYPGIPYPYPQLTVVEGGSGGMEYPMIVLDQAIPDRNRTLEVTAHEIAHAWYPMLVGSNETVYGWQDEGLVTFITLRAQEAMGYEPDPRHDLLMGYAVVAGHPLEVPLMTPANMFSLEGPWYYLAAYAKPALALITLRTALGAEAFDEGLREYTRRWSNRHPSPWDFFNTMEAAAGRDLDWFWEKWFFDVGVLDHAVAEVRPGEGSVEVTVEDRGWLPAPAEVEVEDATGRVVRGRIPAAAWACADRRTVEMPVSGEVAAVTLNPDLVLPDVVPANDRWPAGPERGD